MDRIIVNQSKDFLREIPESASTDTVTYEIFNASGTVLVSGTATFVRDETWKATYTPTALGSITVKFNDTTITSKRSDVYQVVGSVAEETPAGTDFTLDASTNIGKVRYLVNDVVAASYVLSDTQINAFLSMHSNDLFLTAAQCMMAIASSRALLAKRKSAGNYTEDLTAIARECREAAALFKEQANEMPAEGVAEGFYTDFSYRQVLENKALRGEAD